jgi:hypothetical protein
MISFNFAYLRALASIELRLVNINNSIFLDHKIFYERFVITNTSTMDILKRTDECSTNKAGKTDQSPEAAIQILN